MKFTIAVQRVGVDTSYELVFQLQVGVTRIHRGGRVVPRNARGQLVPAHTLVVIEREPIELYKLVTPIRVLREAPLARVVLSLTLRALATQASRPNALVLRSRRVLANLASAFVPTHVRGRLTS